MTSSVPLTTACCPLRAKCMSDSLTFRRTFGRGFGPGKLKGMNLLRTDMTMGESLPDKKVERNVDSCCSAAGVEGIWWSIPRIGTVRFTLSVEMNISDGPPVITVDGHFNSGKELISGATGTVFLLS